MILGSNQYFVLLLIKPSINKGHMGQKNYLASLNTKVQSKSLTNTHTHTHLLLLPGSMYKFFKLNFVAIIKMNTKFWWYWLKFLRLLWVPLLLLQIVEVFYCSIFFITPYLLKIFRKPYLPFLPGSSNSRNWTYQPT